MANSYWVKVDLSHLIFRVQDNMYRTWNPETGENIVETYFRNYGDNVYNVLGQQHAVTFTNPETGQAYLFHWEIWSQFPVAYTHGNYLFVGRAGPGFQSGETSYDLVGLEARVDSYKITGPSPGDNGPLINAIDFGPDIIESYVTYPDGSITHTRQTIGVGPPLVYNDFIWLFAGSTPTGFTEQADDYRSDTTKFPTTEQYWNPDLANDFDALGGNDKVASGALNDTVKGGAGNDTLDGGADDDALSGGADSDSLIGGAGDDRLLGETGNDTIDGGVGDDYLSGGSDVAIDKDIVIISGTPSDFVFIDNAAAGTTALTRKSNQETDTLIGFEDAQFTSKIRSNVVVFENEVLEAAWLAVDSYGSTAARRAGWEPINALELRLPLQSHASVTSHPWQLANGVFLSDGAGGISPLGTSAAHVYGGTRDGQSILAVSFRGTSDGYDVAGWIGFVQQYYDSFRPFVDAVIAYISENNIDKVIVSGHSLGGAMAQLFMQDARVAGDARYSGYTFGSPGSFQFGADPRMLHFAHTDDPVPKAGSLVNFQNSGQIVELNVPIDGIIAAHDKLSYVSTITHLILDHQAEAEALPSFLQSAPRDSGVRLHWIPGTSNNDNLQGDGAVHLNEAIRGFSGVDRISGGGGNDEIKAGSGNDRILAAHADGNDTLTGGPGFDILDFSAVNGVVQVDQLAGRVTGSAGNDTLVDVFEQVIGTAFDDVLSGGHGINVLEGGGGNDRIYGNKGDDLLRGGAGNDTFYAISSDGNDTLHGGPGFDVLDYSGLANVVQVNQLAGTTTGSANNDTLQDVFEQVIGSNFGDVLSGGHGINSLKGNGGNDQIFANNGDDYTSGGEGNDTITMGLGNDTHDFRNGEGVDTILDFTAGGTEDTITLKFYSGLGIASFAQLQASGRLSTVSGRAELTLNGGDKIIFQNVASHTLLTAADFLLV